MLKNVGFNLRDKPDLGFLAFAAFFLVGHLAILSQPFVNLESWYAGTATLLLHARFQDAFRYLETTIANPIGSSLEIVPFYWVFGVSEFSARLPSLVAALGVFGVIYYYIRSLWSGAVALLAVCIVGLSPLFWVFSGLAWSDVPFLFLITAALITAEIACRTANMRLHLAAGVLLAVAALVKYNAVVFVPAIAGITLFATAKRQQDWRAAVREWSTVLGIYIAVCLLILVPYVMLVHHLLGHFLAPRYFQFIVVGAAPSLVTVTILRLVSFVVWIGIFCGPLAVFPAVDLAGKIGWSRLVILGLLFCPAGAFLVQRYLNAQRTLKGYFGEMDLGWTTRLLTHPFAEISLVTLLFLAGTLLVAGLLLWSREDFGARGPLAIWLAAGIGFHSLVRPTNRYVLFVLPPLAFYVAWLFFEPARGATLMAKRFFLTCSLLLLGFLGIFNSIYFATEGRAAAEIARYANTNSLSGIQFDPGNSVQCHSGYLLQPALFISQGSQRPRFDFVTLGPHELAKNNIHEAPVELLGIVFKRYAIIQTE